MKKAVERCLLVVLLCISAGCGGGLEEFPTAKASGKVVCDGKPVPNVRVYFSPKASGTSAISGKSGWGTTNDEGVFVISTYGEEDGAVVGLHRITVDAPHPERFPDFQCNCETDSNRTLMEAEVTEDGENQFTIDLPAKTRKRKRKVSDEDLDDLKDDD